MNLLFLLLFWSLWFLNFSTRTVLSPLLPIFEKELPISHALAGSIFLFLAVGYTSSFVLSNWITPGSASRSPLPSALSSAPELRPLCSALLRMSGVFRRG